MHSKKPLSVTLVIMVKNELLSSQIMFPQIPINAVDVVFVMDGNSTDGTQEYYRKKNITVYTQKRKGLGAAVIETRKHVKTDAFIIFHPDGNEDPKDIIRCVTELKKGHSFIIPSRLLSGGYNEEDKSFLKPRKWFNQSLAWIVNMIWNRKNPYVTELVQGFRAINCKTFDQLKVTAYDATIDFQMVIKAMKHKIPIFEFPTIEGERLYGETHFNSFHTGKIILYRLLKELVS